MPDELLVAVREIARKNEDQVTEAEFDPETGIVTVYEGRREFHELERAARKASYGKKRVPEYVPYRMLEVEAAANAVYAWAAEQILAYSRRRLSTSAARGRRGLRLIRRSDLGPPVERDWSRQALSIGAKVRRDVSEKPPQRIHGRDIDRPRSQDRRPSFRPEEQRRGPRDATSRPRADHQPLRGSRHAALSSQTDHQRAHRR
jgi:hypothetical protein